MSGVLLFVLAGGALVAFALAVVLILRIRRGTTDSSLLLRVTRFLAIAYGALVLIGTAITVASVLIADAVPLTMRVRTFWPSLLPGVEILDGPTASVTTGGFERAEVIVTGLDVPTRLLLAGGHALQGATMALIAGAVVVLCTRLLAGSPFRPVLSRSTTVAAVALAIGGLAWQVCFELAGAFASSQVLTVSAWTWDEAVIPDASESVGWPEPSFGFTLDFWPLMLGLALAALAAAFRHGERLQRDTEGLV